MAQTVSTWTRIQTPVSSASNSSIGFSPSTSCASSVTVIGVAPKLCRIALPRQNGDGGVRGHEVGQEPVTLFDSVVVVGDGLARFDDPVLGSGVVRRLTAREPRRIEAHPIPVAVGRQRGDVSERPVAASSLGGFVFVVGEVQAGEDAGGHRSGGGNDRDGDERDLHDLSRSMLRLFRLRPRRKE